MTDRLCAYVLCSKPLVRRGREKPSQFAARTCCDASCANRKAKNSTVPADLPTEKTCKECGALTHQRKGESANRWAARECCSRECASRHNMCKINQARDGARVEQPQRMCIRPGCGNALVQRPNEKTNRFKVRETCSIPCANSVRVRRAAVELTPCAREGCDTLTKTKYCSRACSSLARRNASGDARRAGRQREQTRKQTGTPRTRVARKPVEVVAPAPVPRPSPEALLPDPAVVDMDRKRAEAERMFDDGTAPHQVARLLGVSMAQARRWEEGAA